MNQRHFANPHSSSRTGSTLPSIEAPVSTSARPLSIAHRQQRARRTYREPLRPSLSSLMLTDFLEPFCIAYSICTIGGVSPAVKKAYLRYQERPRKRLRPQKEGTRNKNGFFVAMSKSRWDLMLSTTQTIFTHHAELDRFCQHHCASVGAGRDCFSFVYVLTPVVFSRL